MLRPASALFLPVPTDWHGLAPSVALGSSVPQILAPEGRNCLYDRVRTRRSRIKGLARPLGRSNFDAAGIHKLAGAFDLLLSMVKVLLDLPAFINALAPNGRVHFVGVNSCPSLANNQDRRIYGAVKKREFSWKCTI
jgi:D-arabinose 1-dehydrogenase-like Zn-dependent alcohol dehydrogenase